MRRPPASEPSVAPLEEERTGARVLVQYWRIALYYKWSILGIALIGALFGALSALRAVPAYQADARLLVRFNQPNVSGFQQFDASPMYWMFYETQVDILRSRSIAERVVDRLDLVRGAQVAPAAAPQSEAESTGWQALLDEHVLAWRSWRDASRDWRDWIPPEWRPQPAPAIAPRSPRATAAGRVIAGLHVSGGKESEVIIVGFRSTDPKEAAQIANAVAEAYIDFGLESRLSSANKATSWLGQRLEELRTKLAESERALSEFQSAEGLVDTASRENIISARLGSLTAELIKAQTRSSGSGARYGQLRELESRGTTDAAAALVLDNLLVTEAHRDVAEVERRVNELSERYGDKHPKMITARGDLTESKRRMADQVIKAIERARKEFEVARAQEVELQRHIDEQQVEMRSLSGKTFELAKREREVEANRNLYEAFLNRFKQADIAEDYDVTNVRIIDRAQVPSVPFAPDKRRMMSSALLVGLLIGLALAFLRHHLDRTFKSTEDVEAELDLPVLGTLGRVKISRRDKPERYVHCEPGSAFSEAVNDVRTALQFSRVDNPPKILLVTSALAGEGKTTLASNLALALAKRGATLLLDGDLRRGRIDVLNDLGECPGLTDLVAAEVTLDEATHQDPDATGLHLMTAGKTPPNPLEVISSSRFASALEEFRSTYEYIVIDGSPLLAVSDSLVLGHLVDGVVMVVQADKTTYDAARDALKRLLGAGIRPLGVVLQQVDLKRMQAYAYRYAYYGRGHYGYTYGREP